MKTECDSYSVIQNTFKAQIWIYSVGNNRVVLFFPIFLCGTIFSLFYSFVCVMTFMNDRTLTNIYYSVHRKVFMRKIILSRENDILPSSVRYAEKFFHIIIKDKDPTMKSSTKGSTSTFYSRIRYLKLIAWI